MVFPEYKIVLEDASGIRERRCSASVYISPDAIGDRNVMTEIVMSSGKVEDVGLYADIYYYAPASMTDDEREAHGDDSLMKLQREHFCRMWFVAPDEADDVLSVREGAAPVLLRINGTLVDCRRLTQIAERYVTALDSKPVTELVAALHSIMAAEMAGRLASDPDVDVDAAIASEMGIPVEMLRYFLEIDAYTRAKEEGAAPEIDVVEEQPPDGEADPWEEVE